ncbi:SLAP domain-containing protein [Metabacillus litoralis]|jgi:SLAP domain-containing protein|uniref:SLAP domain-containing protein n=1 Tax=Metabacillus litoralis TaxID=152268 RepID=UPI002041CCED|nr:SLAP domain-containing protein [Metabacillus litoralis]MCM3654753.1 SLAP domain-containing protein [Metabacillus litoralis]
MQLLRFESSWDKTLSDKDRVMIQQFFLETNVANDESIQFIPLRQALNYKGDLLVTVLIHNFSKQIHLFQDKTLHYLENNKIVAEHIFTLPSLIIESKTSMPWTFIFPPHSLIGHLTLENARLELVDITT